MVDSQKPLVENEPLLSRWSRLKRGQSGQRDSISKNYENDSVPEQKWAIEESAGNSLSASPRATPEASAPTAASNDDVLPSLDDVSLEKDFTPFMQAKIPEALKRQALKTLFKDAHFNTMDGLDTYVDDYTKFEPISAEEMAGLSSWKSIMKPLEQVVTPGGYAVDVESEEGKAVLAAREALVSEDSLSHWERVPDRAGEGEKLAQVSEENTSDLTSPATASRPLPWGEATHERYGKRVGDFKPVDTSVEGGDQSEVLDDATKIDLQFEPTSLTRPVGRPLPVGEVEANDDPR